MVSGAAYFQRVSIFEAMASASPRLNPNRCFKRSSARRRPGKTHHFSWSTPDGVRASFGSSCHWHKLSSFARTIL